jgi:hypothetical protein
MSLLPVLPAAYAAAAAAAAAAAGAVWACRWRLCFCAILHKACDAQQRGRSIVSTLLPAFFGGNLWPVTRTVLAR